MKFHLDSGNMFVLRNHKKHRWDQINFDSFLAIFSLFLSVKFNGVLKGGKITPSAYRRAHSFCKKYFLIQIFCFLNRSMYLKVSEHKWWSVAASHRWLPGPYFWRAFEKNHAQYEQLASRAKIWRNLPCTAEWEYSKCFCKNCRKKTLCVLVNQF